MLDIFDEVQGLIDRSDKHLEWLKDYIPHFNEKALAYNPDAVSLDESFDLITREIRITLGKFANCLRSVLDYLTCAVVEQDSLQEASNRVQFPIEDQPDVFQNRRDTQLKGLLDKHVPFFERYQPYNNSWNWTALLRDLTNFNKHRGLINVKKTLHQVATLSPALGDTKGSGSGPDKMQMQSGLAFTISFKNGSNIISQLEVIRHGVQEIVAHFRSLLCDSSPTNHGKISSKLR
jgi:hypothetical protein